MLFNDYIAAVKKDAIECIEQGEYSDYESFNDAFESMFIDDSITGNGSGSYTLNRHKAEENIKDLLFDDMFLTEVEGLGYTVSGLLSKGAEAIDVIARCIALEYTRADIEHAFNKQ